MDYCLKVNFRVFPQCCVSILLMIFGEEEEQGSVSPLEATAPHFHVERKFLLTTSCVSALGFLSGSHTAALLVISLFVYLSSDSHVPRADYRRWVRASTR